MTPAKWRKLSMAEQAEAWENMTDSERRAVRPGWQRTVASSSADMEAVSFLQSREDERDMPKEPDARLIGLAVFGLVMAAAVIIGVIAWRSMPDPLPAIKVSISADSVTIQNPAFEPIEDVVLYANGAPGEGFWAAVGTLSGRDSMTVPMTSFADDSGRRMQPLDYVFTEVWLVAPGYKPTRYGGGQVE